MDGGTSAHWCHTLPHKTKVKGDEPGWPAPQRWTMLERWKVAAVADPNSKSRRTGEATPDGALKGF